MRVVVGFPALISLYEDVAKGVSAKNWHIILEVHDSGAINMLDVKPLLLIKREYESSGIFHAFGLRS